MPPRKKDPLAEARAIAAEFGIELPEEIKAPSVRAEEKARVSQQETYAGTLLLDSLPYRQSPAVRTCDGCQRSFMTNYTKDRYCSRDCMVRAFEKRFHVKWDSLNPPQSYWENEPPLRISPDLTDVIYDWAKSIVEAYESPESPSLSQLSPRERVVEQALLAPEEEREEILLAYSKTLDQQVESESEPLTPGLTNHQDKPVATDHEENPDLDEFSFDF